MISICIVSKDKTLVKTNYDLHLHPLIDCVRSIWTHRYKVDEIVIADYNNRGETARRLQGIVDENVVGLNIIQVNEKFARGAGRNIAFRHSTGDIICFLDADMLLTSSNLFKSGLKIAESGGAFFPICYSYYNHQNTDGWWRTTGFGNLIVSRENFNKYGWWNEKREWGGEDDAMYMKLSRNIPIVRTKVGGFYHQWHPVEPRVRKPWYKRIWR